MLIEIYEIFNPLCPYFASVGVNSYLPKELSSRSIHSMQNGNSANSGDAFITVPMIRAVESELDMTCAWDSTIHDSIYLNRCTNAATERIFTIIRCHVRLSHPQMMDIILR